MKKLSTFQTRLAAFGCTLLLSGLAHADRPPLEALESLTMDLANVPSVVSAPTVAAETHAVKSIDVDAIAPAVRTMAPVAAARVDATDTTVATSEVPKATSLSSLREQEAKQAKTPTVAGGSLNGWLAIGFVLMVMGAVAVWLKRKGTKPAGLPSAEDITPLAVTRLWGKHSIGLVKVSGRVLVVGLGENGMSLLTELEEADLPASLSDADESEQSDFTASLISRFQNKTKSASNDPFATGMDTSSFSKALQSGGNQLQLTQLQRQSQPGPAEELLGLSEERAAIRRRLDALRQRNLRVA